MIDKREFSDEELAAAFVSPQWGDLSETHCVDSELLWKAACNRLSEEEMSGILGHVADCSICAWDLRAARELAAEQGEIVGKKELFSRSLYRRLVRKLRRFCGWIFESSSRSPNSLVGSPMSGALADEGYGAGAGKRVDVLRLGMALLLLGVGVGVGAGYWNAARMGWEISEHPRGGYDAIKLLLEDGQEVDRAGFLLQWVGPKTVDYTLVVQTETLEDVLAVKGLGVSRYFINSNLLEKVEPGSVLFCSVEAGLESGGRVRSATRRVVVK